MDRVSRLSRSAGMLQDRDGQSRADTAVGASGSEVRVQVQVQVPGLVAGMSPTARKLPSSSLGAR